jgi:hypothetical protein
MQLRAHDYAVMVVSPNPIAFEAHALTLDARARQAMRIAETERAFNFQLLRRSGIQVVDWDVNLPLDSVIHESLAKQPVSRRRVRIMQ